MKKLTFAILVFLLKLGFAQDYPVVTLGTSEAFPHGLCEPSISINRANPDNLVAGVILDQVFYSNDGGKSWVRDTLTSPHGVWGDPVVLSDYERGLYYLHLSDPTGLNWLSSKILDRIVCQKSTDGGETWNDGTYMGYNPPKDQDKHWAVVDPRNNNLHVTWTQFDKYGSKSEDDHSNILYANSHDGGESWSAPQILSNVSGNCVDDDSTTEGAVPAVGPHGELYVTWSNANKLYFDKSTDGGRTWLQKDRVIAKQPGGWSIDVDGLQRANGMPVTICDISYGPHRGNLYVNWVDDRNGNYDVFFMKSEDGGETWTEPQRINDDSGDADQFFTWMTCDPHTGYLHAVFYDRRHHDSVKTDVYWAYSKDGGESWTNQKISEKPFEPVSSVFFGDYNHIDAYQNRIRPIWTHYEDGKLSVKTALIEMH